MRHLCLSDSLEAYSVPNTAKGDLHYLAHLQTTHEPAYQNAQPVSYSSLYFTLPGTPSEEAKNHVTRLLSGVLCLGGITYTPFNDHDDTYRPELPDPWEWTPSYAPTTGYLHHEWTPSVICPSPGAEEIVHERSPSLQSHPSEQLVLLPRLIPLSKRPPNGTVRFITDRIGLNCEPHPQRASYVIIGQESAKQSLK